MPVVSIDSSELNKVIAHFEKAAAGISKSASDVVRKTAFDVQADAKVFVPVGETGLLRESIKVFGPKADETGITATVAATANYAPYVEFGTSRMAPRAFLGPALDRRTPEFVKAMRQIAVEAVQG